MSTEHSNYEIKIAENADEAEINTEAVVVKEASLDVEIHENCVGCNVEVCRSYPKRCKPEMRGGNISEIQIDDDFSNFDADNDLMADFSDDIDHNFI